MPRAAPSTAVKVPWDDLVRAAREIRQRAYAPYSRFKVGAAVLGESGRIYVGCNVENASYGLTVCAERHAVAHAVAGGEGRILACAIAAGAAPCPPCGACRQVLAEFAGATLPVALLGRRSRVIHTLAGLLPQAFGRGSL